MTALMIFAAGLGTRMGPLTADRPKPMIPVAGRPLIDHALAVAEAAGADPVVVNLHWRAEVLARHLQGRGVVLSDETDQLRDTGGGLRHALPRLGPGPLWTLNSDAVWTGPNPLKTLAAAWDGARMDALLLVAPRAALPHPPAKGDFALAPDGRLSRGRGGEDHVFLGAQMLVPDGLHAIADRVFSLNRLWDRIAAAGRLHGALHPGGWVDVGHPAGIVQAEALLHG